MAGSSNMTIFGPAALRETHSAVVFLVGDRAYKLKKPVDLGFLDFSTREAREAVCHREVELDRRFAPNVYLGVADVLGPDGTVCDHLVVMRRMPEDRRLSTLVTPVHPLGTGFERWRTSSPRSGSTVLARADTSDGRGRATRATVAMKSSP